MANPEHHIVVSWTAGDDLDCASYMVAIYPHADACEPADFVTVDDSESEQDVVGICCADNQKILDAVAAFAREYNLDTDSLPITWDI